MGLNKRLIGAGATARGALTPSENFKAVIYTGNGGTQAITGVGFKPDFVWLKNRDGNTWHNLHNSTRGATKHLYSNASNAEDTTADGLTSFDSDGFTLGSGNGFNNSGVDFVAWCWKANGGTTSSNSDGSITSTVQANTDSGFSIIQYTGTGSAATIGHGLGVAPDIIFSKRTSSSADWVVGVSDWTKYLELNGTPGFRTASSVWNNTAPTSTVFSVAGSGGSNGSGETNIAYAFKSIDGFSKIGTYTGNGSDNGPIVETGFEPAFLMFKRTDSASAWVMIDNARDTSNPRLKYLMAQGVNSEAADLNGVDFLSNGFQIKDDYADWNTSGSPYIYIAFAADPDTEAPTLASSFNIETYTGTGAAQSITGTGFLPNLVWIKDRDTNFSHALTDSVRGVGNIIKSNSSDAQSTDAQTITSFDSNGFSIGTAGGSFGNSGDDYVAWSWKADDNEPTIFGGPAKAVYKFEDNANDVTGDNNASSTSNVTYTSSGKFNKAAVFNGSSSKITLANGSFRYNELSISVWVKPAGSGNRTIFDNYDIESGSSKGALFRIDNSTNKARFVIYNGDCTNPYPDDTSCSNVTAAVSTSAISTSEYTHIVVTMKLGELKMYINGELDVSTITQSIGYKSDCTTNIGVSIHPYTSGESFFNGEIDQVRIYNGVVSDVGVAELYAETVSDNDDLELGGPPEIIVSANANAGMSIVDWQQIPATGTTVPHGLSAAPNMIITKAQNDTDNWYVYHSAMGTGKFIYLNLSNAQVSNAGGYSAVGASTFTSNLSNNSGINMISYCFHDVAGYQKFGSYTGTGSSNSITGLGFKPDFILFKKTNASQDWLMVDSLRGGQKELVPNNDSAEYTMSNGVSSFDSDGWTMGANNSLNTSGSTYIYWAIKIN